MKNKEGNWRINSLMVMSLITTLNFLTFTIASIGIWKKWMGKEVLNLPKIDFVPLLMFIFLIFILSFIVHYFLIFYSKKYIDLLKVENEVANGLLSKYFIISGLSLLFLYFLFKVII
jgi:hypothetical protein